MTGKMAKKTLRTHRLEQFKMISLSRVSEEILAMFSYFPRYHSRSNSPK